MDKPNDPKEQDSNNGPYSEGLVTEFDVNRPERVTIPTTETKDEKAEAVAEE